MATCFVHRRSSPAPVITEEDAIRALMLATDGGRDPCAVVACLDQRRRPLTMFVVDGLVGQARLLLDVVLDAAAGPASPLASLFVAVCRPGGEPEIIEPDIELFDDAADRCRLAGLDLLDLFVVGEGSARSVASCTGGSPWR